MLKSTIIIMLIFLSVTIHSKMKDCYNPNMPVPPQYSCLITLPVSKLIKTGNEYLYHLKKNKGTEVNFSITFDYFDAACEKGSIYGCKKAYETIKIFGDHNFLNFFGWSVVYQSHQKFRNYIKNDVQKHCKKNVSKDFCNICKKDSNSRKCKGCYIKCALKYKYDISEIKNKQTNIENDESNHFIFIIVAAVLIGIVIFVKSKK